LKISVVGNIAGGKTRMSRALSRLYKIEVTHVDQIQFIPPMNIRPLHQTRRVLLDLTQEESWIIDGYGPLDLLESRFLASDYILFIDLPFYRHIWWLFKRQLFIRWRPRPELHADCIEASWPHTQKLILTLWRMQTKMLPQLRRMLDRDIVKSKVITVRTLKEWNQVYKYGIKKGQQIAGLQDLIEKKN
jgi:adenylate kinase family enzyme